MPLDHPQWPCPRPRRPVRAKTSSSCTGSGRWRSISARCEILILNLMPTKIATETQIARLLANTPLQVHMTLLQTASHVCHPCVGCSP